MVHRIYSPKCKIIQITFLRKMICFLNLSQFEIIMIIIIIIITIIIIIIICIVKLGHFRNMFRAFLQQ